MENLDKSKLNLSKNEFNSFLQKYKDYLIPIFIVISCFLILFFVIFPQFQNFLVSRQKLEAETQKLNILKNNYNFLSNLDDNKNTSDLKTLSIVLPPTKDFAGIINALSVASSKTGVGLGDFSFSVGDLSKTKEVGDSSQTSIKLEVDLNGSANLVTNFINELYKTAPLSEIISVKTNASTSTLTVVFYYKSFPPQNVSDDAAVAQISSKNLNLLRQIYSWDNLDNQSFPGIIPISSDSANLSSQSSGLNSSPF